MRDRAKVESIPYWIVMKNRICKNYKHENAFCIHNNALILILKEAKGFICSIQYIHGFCDFLSRLLCDSFPHTCVDRNIARQLLCVCM